MYEIVKQNKIDTKDNYVFWVNKKQINLNRVY